MVEEVELRHIFGSAPHPLYYTHPQFLGLFESNLMALFSSYLRLIYL